MLRRRLSTRSTVFGALALALVLLLLLWDWDWFRPVVEARASAALGREVRLQHFDIDLGRNPLIEAEGITIANPPEFPPGTHLGSVERLGVRIAFWPLLRREVRLLQIDALRPLGDLRPGPQGTRNWKFTFDDQEGTQVSGDRGVDIGGLNIRDGHLHVVEPDFKADFTLDFRTEPAPDGEPRLRIDAKGTYADQPIEGRFIGGSVLSLRDPDQPYPVDLEAVNGETRIDLKGTLQRPLELAGALLDLKLSGDDLAKLYPLTGVPLPPTAAYRIEGRLEFTRQRVLFREFSGVVGGSDVAGDLTVDLSGEKRLIVADLQSKKVVLADLAGFIGATPGKPGAPGDTVEHQQERAVEKASPRALPDRPINLPKIRVADFDVIYRGERIESENMPLDKVLAHLIIRDGYLSLEPLSFGVGEGQIAGNVELDGRGELVHTVANIDFRRLDLKRLMRDVKFVEGTGLIGGTARIDTHGNSMADALARGNGEVKLFMVSGELSALLVNLAGLEFGKALLSAIGLPEKTRIRCLVSDLELKDGVLGTRTLLLDTEEANLLLQGTINLSDEAIDLKLRSQPKRFGIASLRGPVHLGGRLKDPDFGIEVDDVAARGGIAAILGTLLGPLGALIPTIELGLGKDNDCQAMIESVRASMQALKRGGLPPPPADRKAPAKPRSKSASPKVAAPTAAVAASEPAAQTTDAASAPAPNASAADPEAKAEKEEKERPRVVLRPGAGPP